MTEKQNTPAGFTFQTRSGGQYFLDEDGAPTALKPKKNAEPPAQAGKDAAVPDKAAKEV